MLFQLQYAPPTRGRRLPSSLVSKGFTFSQGKINLEVTLDKEIYYHGEKLGANVTVNNNSRKAVKNIKVRTRVEVGRGLKRVSRPARRRGGWRGGGSPATVPPPIELTCFSGPTAAAGRRHGVGEGVERKRRSNVTLFTPGPRGRPRPDASVTPIRFRSRCTSCSTAR